MNALVALHEIATPGDTARVVTVLEHELHPFIAPPATPAIQVRPIDRRTIEVTWDETGAVVEGYVIEVAYRHGGEFRRYGVVDADARSAEVRDVSAVRVRAFNAGGLSAPSAAFGQHPRRRSVAP
jgi:hypothetical protein